jgi:diacylglycerol kinase
MRQYLIGRQRSFSYAIDGLKYVFRTQKNAQIHLLVITVVLVAALWLQLPLVNFAIIFLAIGLVLGAEFFNTAAETLVDMVSTEHHPLARIVKDVCAGGVLVCAICAVAVGIFLMGPALLARLSLITP